MTIDLTNAADAGWMSFQAERVDETDDGCTILRITRGNTDWADVAVTEEDGRPEEVTTIGSAETVSPGWLEEAHRWLWKEVLSPPPD